MRDLQTDARMYVPLGTSIRGDNGHHWVVMKCRTLEQHRLVLQTITSPPHAFALKEAQFDGHGGPDRRPRVIGTALEGGSRLNSATWFSVA